MSVGEFEPLPPSFSEIGKDYYSFRSRLKRDEVDTIMAGLQEQPDLAAHMDTLREADSSRWYDVVNAIQEVPPPTILEKMGAHGLHWLAAVARLTDVYDRESYGVPELLGYDWDLLKKARQWEWAKNAPSVISKMILRQHELFEHVAGRGTDMVEVADVVSRSAKPGITLSQDRLAAYGLRSLRVRKTETDADGPERDWYVGEHEPGISYRIWLDAPVGFALTYKGRPQALASFAARQGNELALYQLQGVKPLRVDPSKKYTDGYAVGKIPSRGLMPIDWQKILVECTDILAAQLGFDTIAIQSAAHNKWATEIQRGETQPHMTLEAAERAYDETAQRLGFYMGQDGDWHRETGISAG